MPKDRISASPLPPLGPLPDLPPAAFLGTWTGAWASRFLATLDVTAVAEDGSLSGVYIFDGRESSLEGLKVENGVLRFGQEPRVTVLYIARDGSMRGTFGPRSAAITMHRQQDR